MKYFSFILLLTGILYYGCTKEEEPPIELFSTEAYAYDLGDSWEVNATARVKGFVQREEKENVMVALSYAINLVTPAGDTLNSVFSDKKELTESEEISDIPLDAQFTLDSTYTVGRYKLIFNVSDTYTDKKTSAVVEFDIIEED